MKLETFAVTSKAICSFLGPALLAYNGAISQWSNEATGPSFIQWTMIISASLGAGVLGYGSFTSNAFGKYISARTNNEISINGDTSIIKKEEAKAA